MHLKNYIKNIINSKTQLLQKERIFTINVAKQWNPKQALLKSLLEKADTFDEAIKLCLEMHLMLHSSGVENKGIKTYEDELWFALDEKAFRSKLSNKEMTIAWNIWHLTRIEDLTANILIANNTQVLNSESWLNKMNIKISDTGNSMTEDEIIAFSSSIDMTELRNYRIAVGKKTQEIIKNLEPKDIKRKIENKNLQRILSERGVLVSSTYLLDFWGRKTVAGILLMPITRHQIVHLNDSLRIKEKGQKNSFILS